MKVKELLQFGYAQLGKEMILDAEVLLAHAINKDRGWMLAHPEMAVDDATATGFKAMIERRKLGEPVAYITRTKEFFGLDFKVNNHVLVPRPETELLVEMGLEEADQQISRSANKIIVVDVGTGSGAIAISVVKNNPQARVLATDISRDALEVAKENVFLNKIDDRLFLYEGNLLESIEFHAGQHYIILANLPYLSYEEYVIESSIKYEPKVALVADEDGNALYRELFEQIKKLPEAVTWTLFAEFDPRHAVWMLTTAKEYFPNKEIKIQKDLAGRERILCVR